MNELIQSLQEKVGLSADQAKDAVTHVVDYFKTKLPAILHEHFDAAALGDKIKSGGSEFLAEAQSKGGDFLHNAQEKLTSFLHSKEA